MNVRVYVRHEAVQQFGNDAAQLDNLASYPVLTRIYSPSEQSTSAPSIWESLSEKN